MLRLYYETAGGWQVVSSSNSKRYDGETVEAILDYAKKNFANGYNWEIREIETQKVAWSGCKENGEIREGVLRDGKPSAPVTFRRLVTGRRFRG